jgi:radical SAM-linked protein
MSNKMSYIYRIKYRKSGPLKFISHLDLNVLFRRMLRRTSIPIELTQGFNPRFRLSFGPALSLGIEGWQEILDVYLKKELNSEQIKESINNVAPNGLTVIDAEKVNELKASLNKSLRWAFYLIELAFDEGWKIEKTGEWIERIKLQIKNFLNQKNILIEKQTKKGLKEIDLRPYIQKLEFLFWKNNQMIIRLIVDIQYRGSINPRLIMNAFINKMNNESINIRKIYREKIILEADVKDGNKFIQESLKGSLLP